MLGRKPKTDTETAAGQGRRRRIWLKALVAFFCLLVLGVAIALNFPQQLLCVDDGPVRADAIVVLGGGSAERPRRAAELYHQGAAPKIVVSGGDDARDKQQVLLDAGVPAAAIELEDKSRNTKENAVFSLRLLRQEEARSVIVVTSWFHSRRARNCFRHYGSDIEVYSRPTYYAFPRQDWRREGIRPFIWLEYLKIPAYWVCYGVSPF